MVNLWVIRSRKHSNHFKFILFHSHTYQVRLGKDVRQHRHQRSTLLRNSQKKEHTRLLHILGGQFGSACFRMTENHDIWIAFHTAHGILKSFSLLGGGSGFLNGDDLSSESAEGSMERGGSTSRRLEENVCHHAMLYGEECLAILRSKHHILPS